MDVLLALLAGSAAGLALAAPLGAIGVLLLQEGMTRGLRGGLPAAAAVATVDLSYCAAAFAAGALAGPIVSGWSPWPQLLGGVAVIALGSRGLLQGVHARPSGGAASTDRSGPSRRRFLLFLGLTAINPATLVYFAAILTGLADFTRSMSTAVAFVAGVGLASFGWQTALVALGAGLRRRTGDAFRRWTAVVGNGLIVAFGVALIVRAV